MSRLTTELAPGARACICPRARLYKRVGYLVRYRLRRAKIASSVALLTGRAPKRPLPNVFAVGSGKRDCRQRTRFCGGCNRRSPPVEASRWTSTGSLRQTASRGMPRSLRTCTRPWRCSQCQTSARTLRLATRTNRRERKTQSRGAHAVKEKEEVTLVFVFVSCSCILGVSAPPVYWR